jgi:hypothetical protein
MRGSCRVRRGDENDTLVDGGSRRALDTNGRIEVAGVWQTPKEAIRL